MARAAFASSDAVDAGVGRVGPRRANRPASPTPSRPCAGAISADEVERLAAALAQQVGAADRLVERAQPERRQDLAHLLGDVQEVG